MKITILIFSLLISTGLVFCDKQDTSRYCINQDGKPLQCASYSSLVQDSGSVPPKYIVNLDLSYSDRWKQIITDFKSPIQGFYARLESMEKLRNLQPQTPFYADSEFLNELKAISDLAGVNNTTTQLLSQMYEVLDAIACTSILARSGDGSIIHARNLDYSFVKYISPLLANVEFQKGGKTVFFADMVVGTNIVVTGLVPNGFSITINQRQDDGQAISYLKKQYIPACYLMYKVLQTKTTYDDAVKALSSINIAMPAYLIIAGLSGNQGVVLQRDREGVNMTTTLSDSTWFICQTNYDRLDVDPISDYRRIPCEQKMGNLKQSTFTGSDIYAILSQQPNFVVNTITTDIMIPKTGYINSTRWFNPNKTLELTSATSVLSISISSFLIIMFMVLLN